MTTNAVVVTGLLPTSNGSYVDFTSAGFGTPDAAIVIVSNANSTNNPQSSIAYSVGFWTASAQALATVSANDNVATDNVTWRKTQTGDVALQLTLPDSTTASTLTEISATSTTNGLRLTKDSGSSGVARYATVILINGCLNEYVGSVNLGTGTSAIDVTAPGFRADLIFALTVGAGDNTGLAQAILSFGAAHINSSNAVSQGLISFSSEDAVATSDVDTMVRDDAIACQNFNGTLSWRAGIGAHASGFTITPNANTSSDIIHYLALELADPDDAYVAIKDTITGTGDQAYTGAGFTPTALILGQTMCTAVNTNTSQGYFGIGAGGPASVERSLGIIDEDAQSTTDNESFADLSNIVNIRSQVGSVDTIASLTSLDADGWTLNYSDGSANARKMLAIAIGDSTAGGGITGTISATESGSDVAALSGAIRVSGSINGSESGSDSASLAGDVHVSGTISVSETGADVASIIGGLVTPAITGSIAASETGSDTASLAGDVIVSGVLSVSEAGADTAFINGSSAIITTGAMSASESGSDGCAITGKVYLAGELSAVEGGLDGFAVSGNIYVSGVVSASESGSDTALIDGRTPGTGTLDPATIAAIADAVWAHSSAVDFSDKMLICSRILRNRTVTDPVSGVMTVYADDNVTPYLTAQLYENITETQTYRGQGAEVRARLT